MTEMVPHSHLMPNAPELDRFTKMRSEYLAAVCVTLLLTVASSQAPLTESNKYSTRNLTPTELEVTSSPAPRLEEYVTTEGRSGFETSTRNKESSTASSSTSALVSLDCPTEPQPLNQSEFEDKGNNTVLYNGQLRFYNTRGRPVVCFDNMSPSESHSITLLPGILEISYTGFALTILGTVLILTTYGLFDELQTLPGLILMNLAVMTLVKTLFIMGALLLSNIQEELCSFVAIGQHVHFLILGQFVWMSLFLIEMTHSFYQAKKMVPTGKRNKARAISIYMLIGWGIPLGIVVISIILNYSGTGLVQYGVINTGACFITHIPSLIASFILPNAMFTILNAFLLVAMTTLLCYSAKNKTSERKADYKTLVRVWLAAFFVTGLLWGFGFVAITDSMSPAWYPFVILNSSLGFVIFLIFLCTKKVFMLYCSLLQKKMACFQ